MTVVGTGADAATALFWWPAAAAAVAADADVLGARIAGVVGAAAAAATAAAASLSVMQHENSQRLSPQPWACWPPCNQQLNERRHGRTLLWCRHSVGRPRTV